MQPSAPGTPSPPLAPPPSRRPPPTLCPPQATPPSTSPCKAAKSGSATTPERLFAAAIGYFDPSAASPALQTPAVMSGWSQRPSDRRRSAGHRGSGRHRQRLESERAWLVTTPRLIRSAPWPDPPGGSCGLRPASRTWRVAPGGSEFAVACHDSGRAPITSTARPASARCARWAPPPTRPVTGRGQLRRRGRHRRRHHDLRALPGPVHLPAGQRDRA